MKRIQRTRLAPPRVLGIDASLSSTGICFRDENQTITVRLIEGGALRGGYRLSYMRRKLHDILLTAKPDLVVIEDYAISGRMGANSVLGIAELGGVYKTLVWEHGIPLLSIRPTSMKMVIAGKGNAKKPQVALAIANNFGTFIKQNDAADACGLMLAGEIKVQSPLIPKHIYAATRVGKLAETEIVPGAKMKLIAT